MAKIGVSDTYFAGEEGIYKVYDLDYEAKVQYYTDLEKSKMFGLFWERRKTTSSQSAATLGRPKPKNPDVKTSRFGLSQNRDFFPTG